MPPPQYNFPSDSMLWRICRHRVTLLTGPAAAVLQIAHPRIALGVHDHSDFQSSPTARLHRTLETIYTLTFESPDCADLAARRVSAIHATVQGDAAAHSIPGPAHYSAAEPDLLMWVLATLVMSAIDGYERSVTRLTPSEKELFYKDMRTLGAFFALPTTYGPQSWPDFLAYWDHELSDPTLGAHPLSRRVAQAVARPTRPWWLHLASLPLQFIYSEVLPPDVATRLGFRSTLLKRLTMSVTTRALRLFSRFAPNKLRFVPQYNRAIRQLQVGSASADRLLSPATPTENQSCAT
jgi:uncharacterized protein (DUF2236 family)